MTPAERTAARIASNQRMDKRIEQNQAPKKMRQRVAHDMLFDMVGQTLETLQTREMSDNEFAMALMGLGKFADKVRKVK